MPRITLLTDFGTRDGYVGAMKGVMASLYPGVVIDDVSHEVEQGDVDQGAWTLRRYWRRYPPRTVHVVVVDPGVGTERRGVCLEVDRRYIVAPDNGLVSHVVREAEVWRAVELSDRRYLPDRPSRTFHGRDLFAPAGAHLAQGLHPSRLGPAVEELVLLEEPEPITLDGGVEGEVVTVDRFGNLVTNLPAAVLEGGSPEGEGGEHPPVRVEVGEGRRVPVAPTYGAVEPGTPLALQNSDGRLEIAVRDGSARKWAGRGRGARVRVWWNEGHSQARK